MIEVGISEAQSRFTKLLKQAVLIVDKKVNRKKAVILPYEEYLALLRKCRKEEKRSKFDAYVGLLDESFESDDPKYRRIVE